MKIEILCHDCEKFEEVVQNVADAAAAVGITYELTRISGRHRTAPPGCPGWPELLINGELRSIGRVPSFSELENLFKYILKTGL